MKKVVIEKEFQKLLGNVDQDRELLTSDIEILRFFYFSASINMYNAITPAHSPTITAKVSNTLISIKRQLELFIANPFPKQPTNDHKL